MKGLLWWLPCRDSQGASCRANLQPLACCLPGLCPRGAPLPEGSRAAVVALLGAGVAFVVPATVSNAELTEAGRVILLSGSSSSRNAAGSKKAPHGCNERGRSGTAKGSSWRQSWNSSGAERNPRASPNPGSCWSGLVWIQIRDIRSPVTEPLLVPRSLTAPFVSSSTRKGLKLLPPPLHNLPLPQAWLYLRTSPWAQEAACSGKAYH